LNPVPVTETDVTLSVAVPVLLTSTDKSFVSPVVTLPNPSEVDDSVNFGAAVIFPATATFTAGKTSFGNAIFSGRLPEGKLAGSWTFNWITPINPGVRPAN